MAILAIVVVVKHKNFVVQAGVIPQSAGVVKEPSSVIAPGDRYVKSNIAGSRMSASTGMESALLESEAPVGVPMGILSQSDQTSPSAQATISVQPTLTAQPGGPAQSNLVAPPEQTVQPGQVAPTEETVQPVHIGSAPASKINPAISAAANAANILKAAEASLAEAKGSLRNMRLQQSMMLKSEAEKLQQKSAELYQEAQDLILEANALEDLDDAVDTVKPVKPGSDSKPDGSDASGEGNNKA